MKGIILAGGSGTRLYPLSTSIVKQLLPVYDKPMIYYPLSTLMLAGIKEILIISTPDDTSRIEKVLGNGNQIGLNIQYKIQEKPEGIAQAFLIGEEFIDNNEVCLILGDNIFYGHDLPTLLKQSIQNIQEKNIANIYGYYSNNPKQFGVIEFDSTGKVISIEEKPTNPKSNYVQTGLYFYPSDVVEKAKSLKPSKRGELEITDLNNLYLQEGRLSSQILGRGYTWMDTGSPSNLLKASNFVQIIEETQGLKISCIEEIAFFKKFITKDQLAEIVKQIEKSEYGKYLKKIIDKPAIYL